MKQLKTNPKYILNRYLVIAGFFLLLASFFDLQISKIFYMRGTFYPNLIRFTGEMPMIILAGGLCIDIGLRYVDLIADKKKELVNYPLFILAILGFFLLSLISSLGIPTYFQYQTAYSWIFIFIFYLAMSILAKSLYKDIDLKNLEKFFIFILLSISISMVLLSFMKNTWSRSRFFYMHEQNDYKDFSQWIIPQFRKDVEDIYKSFPSGHTTSASLVLAWLYLTTKVPDKSYPKYLSSFFRFWPLLVAVGRILDGAHYLSDVSFAIIMVTLIIKACHYLIYER
ncbi:MAG: phosphatase PAP2 family protein [Tissierellia bacterium]|nr:phosphatase PAP2 family protein [Tissierellia bacterium]